MFDNDIFAADGPYDTHIVGARLKLPDAADPELAFADVGDERFRYFTPHAPPNIGPDRIDFDDQAGHWQLRPLRDGDREWALQPNWTVPGDLEAFRNWARWRAGLRDEPPIVAVYNSPAPV